MWIAEKGLLEVQTSLLETAAPDLTGGAFEEAPRLDPLGMEKTVRAALGLLQESQCAMGPGLLEEESGGDLSPLPGAPGGDQDVEGPEGVAPGQKEGVRSWGRSRQNGLDHLGSVLRRQGRQSFGGPSAESSRPVPGVAPCSSL